jgi:hypothetical protein
MENKEPPNNIDEFDRALSEHFDELIAKMSKPGAAEATCKVLFGDIEELQRCYKPGSTETRQK